jgi:hypothetical protein
MTLNWTTAHPVADLEPSLAQAERLEPQLPTVFLRLARSCCALPVST